MGDFTIGADNFGTTGHVSSSLGSLETAVPEPPTTLLLSAGMMGLLAYAWQRWVVRR